MSTIETPSEFRAAFDTLLADTSRLLRIYDRDLSMFDIDLAPRHAALRALCVAGGGRRIELLLDDISSVARTHPRLMRLVRDFSHVLEIRQADSDAPRPEQAFVLADHRGVLVRVDKAAIPGILNLNDPGRANLLNQSFEGMWQRSPASVSASTSGL
jgi:hypothetical protein